MANIKIERPHALGAEEAKRRVSEALPRLKESFGLDAQWQGDRARFSGKGYSGNLIIAAASVAIDLKLGLLVRPFAGKIREAIVTRLDEALRP